MSSIIADTIKGRSGKASDFPEGATVTGVVTATTFVGALTGNVTGDVTGNTSGTAGGLTGSPSINVTNITASGTLTYDDVTNVDSLGIITARNGARVTAGGINIVSGVSTFANQIDANGSVDITGIITASHGARVTAGGINIVSGVSTFANQIDANGCIDATGIVTASHGFRAATGGANLVGIVTASHGFRAATGGANLVGVVTATSFSGDGSALTGISAGGSSAYFFMGGSSQSLTSATWTRVACGNVYQDSVSGCDPTVNVGRYTIQSGEAGRYYFRGQVSSFSGSNNITRADVKIYKNGSVFAGAYQFVISGTSYFRHVGPQIATMDNASEGDYYELWVTISATSPALSMDAETLKSNYFMGWKIA